METLIIGEDLFLDIEVFGKFTFVWFYVDNQLTWTFGTNRTFNIQFFTDRVLGNLINI